MEEMCNFPGLSALLGNLFPPKSWRTFEIFCQKLNLQMEGSLNFLIHQFVRTATDIAAGLGPCENNSAVIIQGIDPGPTAKKTT